MSEQPVNPNLRPCPDCGQMISRRAPSCPKCGLSFVGDLAPERKPASGGSTALTVMAVVCGAFFLLALVIVVCLVAIGNIGKSASFTFQSVSNSLNNATFRSVAGSLGGSSARQPVSTAPDK